MSLCLGAGATTVVLALEAFTLVWSHSVEKTEWREDWRVTESGLLLESASVEGSGAGMDIPEGATLNDGRWIYRPEIAPVPELRLADAGRAVSDWYLCVDGRCRTLTEIVGAAGQETVLRACSLPGQPF